MKKILFLLCLLIADLGVARAGDTYVKVTSTDQLVEGAEYIIAAEHSTGVYVVTDYNSKQQWLTSTKSGFTVVDKTIIIDTTAPLVFELGGNSDGYTLKYEQSNSSYYIGYSSGTNIEQLTKVTDAKGKWTYEYSKDDDDFMLKSVQASDRLLQFKDDSNNGPIFKAWTTTSLTNGNAPAHLYRKVAVTIHAVSSNDTEGSVFIAGNVITATPADGYRVSNSNPYEIIEGEAQVTQDGNKFTVIAYNDCTIQINFEAIPTHTVTWSVNGEETIEEFSENDTIVFAPPIDKTPSGYTFLGWVEHEISTPQEEAPAYITSVVMGTEDITYYAVFAIAVPDKDIATLIAKDESIGEYTNRTFVDDKDNTWYAYSCGAHTKDNTPLYLLSTNSYLESPEFPETITNISILTYGYANDCILHLKSTENEEEISSVLAKSNEKSELTFDISGAPAFNKFVISVLERSVGFHYIKVTYTATGYRNYCTLAQPFETITLAEACTDGTKYYGTYSSGNALVVPDDLTVSQITVDSEGTLTITDYQTGDVVPANTGVMVSSTTYGEHPVVLSSKEEVSLLDTENYLYPSGNGISAEEMAKEHPDCMYYRLTMHNGKTLGYYWGAEDGGAFYLAPNKAYLAVPTSSSSRISGFDLTNHGTTSIQTRPVAHTDGALYNLYGQRVDDSAKGIMIRNGKKLIKR